MEEHSRPLTNMSEPMEGLTKKMLAHPLRFERASWEDLIQTTRTDLGKILKENQAISDQIDKNCKIVSGCVALRCAADLFSRYLSYLTEKYAYRRLLLVRDSRCVDAALSRVRLLANSTNNDELKRNGHLVLLFHFGRYLEALVLLLKQAKTNVVWAGRRQSQDKTYESFLSFVKEDLTTEWQNTFGEILASLCAGKTVLLFPDSANFQMSGRNKTYTIGGMRVWFDSATDMLIERSGCDVSCLCFHSLEQDRETASLQSISLRPRNGGLQEALDQCMTDSLVEYPWKWDRLKYLHRILVKNGEGGK
jgi:hypothetical protein